MAEMRTADEYDIVVLGSGAAGLTAAVTAHRLGAAVAVFEKESQLGGTTAASGGVVWIPAHDRGAAPTECTVQEATTYLRSFPQMRVRTDLIDAFVGTGAAMLDFVEAATPIRFSINEGFPDYKPENAGGRPDGGRSFNPSPFDFGELGEWAERVYSFPSDWSDVGLDAETLSRLRESSTPGVDSGTNVKVMGQALVAGLLKPLLDGGAAVCASSRAVGLLEEGGRVVGVHVEANGATREVRARHGVILATGGFEWDADLVESFLRGPMRSPVSPPGKTGDGLRMAMSVGASLANMTEAWWSSAVKIPGDQLDGRPRSRSIRSERARPGCIIVNTRGRRFANEAQDYNSLGGAFHQLDPATLSYPNMDSWMVFDEAHFRRYGFLGIPPGGAAPDWFNRSRNLGELASRTGIDAAALVDTVARWNTTVTETMSDPDFGRGVSVYDAFWGDTTLPPGPARTLGALAEPPYYAVPVHVGTIGTKGGPRTDRDGQVIGVDGAPIGGLYAAGNVMASVMGGAYPGAGATLGPAMVFGFRAAHHAVTGASVR